MKESIPDINSSDDLDALNTSDFARLAGLRSAAGGEDIGGNNPPMSDNDVIALDDLEAFQRATSINDKANQ